MKLAISDLALAESMTDLNDSQSRQICGALTVPLSVTISNIITDTQNFSVVAVGGSTSLLNTGSGDINIGTP